MPWTDHIKYADVGNKVDYAAVLPEKDEPTKFKFVGWIRKFVCPKDKVFKAKKEDIWPSDSK